MINILFIGGAGFIGSNLVEEFIKQPNYNILVLETPQANISTISNYDSKLTIIYGFLSDFDLLSSVLVNHSIDIVVHLVSTLIPGSTYDDYTREFESVIFPSVRLMSLCAELNVKFVYFSSGGTIYGNDVNDKFLESDGLAPISYYGLSKQIIESSILFENRCSNLRYLIVRPSNPFGPRQALHGNQGFIAVAIGKILEKSPIVVWGDGNSVRDYIYIDDLTNSFFQLIDKNVENDIVNIGSGNGYSINDIIERLNKIVEYDISVMYERSRNVDVARMVLDISKLHSLIDVKHTSLESGMREFYNYILKELKK